MLKDMGFAYKIVLNAIAPALPFLLAERIKTEDIPTVHGDVVRGPRGLLARGTIAMDYNGRRRKAVCSCGR